MSRRTRELVWSRWRVHRRFGVAGASAIRRCRQPRHAKCLLSCSRRSDASIEQFSSLFAAPLGSRWSLAHRNFHLRSVRDQHHDHGVIIALFCSFPHFSDVLPEPLQRRIARANIAGTSEVNSLEACIPWIQQAPRMASCWIQLTSTSTHSIPAAASGTMTRTVCPGGWGLARQAVLVTYKSLCRVGVRCPAMGCVTSRSDGGSRGRRFW